VRQIEHVPSENVVEDERVEGLEYYGFQALRLLFDSGASLLISFRHMPHRESRVLTPQSTCPPSYSFCSIPGIHYLQRPGVAQELEKLHSLSSLKKEFAAACGQPISGLQV
jgi:hypothetical protein